MIILRAVIVICALLFLASCTSKDVSNEENCWGDFNPSFEYVALVDIYLVEKEIRGNHEIVAIPDGRVILPARLFSPSFGKDDPSIKKIIATGEKIRVDSITRTRGWNFFVGTYDFMDIFGMVDGEKVLLTELALRNADENSPCGQVLSPNPLLLEYLVFGVRVKTPKATPA